MVGKQWGTYNWSGEDTSFKNNFILPISLKNIIGSIASANIPSSNSNPWDSVCVTSSSTTAYIGIYSARILKNPSINYIKENYFVIGCDGGGSRNLYSFPDRTISKFNIANTDIGQMVLWLSFGK